MKDLDMQIKIYYMEKKCIVLVKASQGVPSSSSGSWGFPDPIPFSLLLPVYSILSYPKKTPKNVK